MHDPSSRLIPDCQSVSASAPFVIVTLATSGNGYAEKLLPIWKYHVETAGYADRMVTYVVHNHFENWRMNTMLKPFAIRTALQQFNKPVLWVDVDGVILRQITPEPSADYAMRVRNQEDKPSSWCWCGGTIWIANSASGINIVNAWCDHAVEAAEGCGPYGDVEGEQEILAFLINKRKTGMFRSMHPDMCFVDYLDWGLSLAPRILHRNASRLFWPTRPQAGVRCTLPPPASSVW